MGPIHFITRIARESDQRYASEISEETERSAVARGSGISKRSPATIIEKMLAGRAVIAVSKDGKWAGFSYIDSWAKGEFVSNSGLIVAPEFRKAGVAKAIKQKIFRLKRTMG
ncbi:MAG: hypothetical protein EOO39_17765 [Cytophagaceae bacterium]|nr:MAG: hypothetical protein EOO39_17765 [Cytophagaceae bacterium]